MGLKLEYTKRDVMDTQYQNQRQSERFDCAVPVDGKTGSTFDGLKTVDVSKDGIGFVSNHELPLNQRIAVELSLSPEDDPVVVMGVVKWARQISNSEQFRIGLRFEDVISGSRRGLDNELRHRLNDRNFNFDDLD